MKMKITTITIISVLLFTISCNEKPSIKVERTYGPKLLEIVEDGDRYYEVYHPTDTIIEYEKIYLDGKLDSLTEWGNDGILWSQTKYKNGLRHGKHIVYDLNESGEIKYIQYYENDQLLREETFEK